MDHPLVACFVLNVFVFLLVFFAPESVRSLGGAFLLL